MDFTLAGTVILSGLVIVFIALILLTAIVSVVGRLMGKTVPAKPVLPPAPARPQPPTQPQKAATPAGTDDLPDELVAVITAAVAVAMDGSNYVIRSVQEAPTPRRNARSAWCLAGMVHNTRPL